MPIPDYQSVMLPLLQLGADGAEHRTKDAIAQLAKDFGLTEQEMAQPTPSGKDLVFSNRYGWARTYLKKAGLIRYTAWGKFQITDAGRSLLESQPAKIDISVLKRYPEFLKWYAPAKSEDEDEPDAVAEPEAEVEKETPEELMESTHLKLRKHLESELLAKVMNSSPEYFERLVVNLLTKIGYGGSLADAGRAIGQSHDGGIDGVIKEDRLGLDLIYLQAKRWADNSTVGAPEVQKFVGALAGKKARRGVFLTTSKFSRDALNYAAALENNVVLIDGTQLAGLMFEFGLGVTTVNTYDVKRIDNDFFDEEEL